MFLKVFFVFGCLFLVGCGGGSLYESGTPCHSKYYNRAYNKPYDIKGVTYYPQKHYEYCETGIASYYGGRDVFHGRKTSNGETFDMNSITAAHKTLPIPCVALVTNLENGRSLKVKINDRGPFVEGRIIDVSRKVAQLLGFYKKGTAKIKVQGLVAESRYLADAMATGKGKIDFKNPVYKEEALTLIEARVPPKKTGLKKEQKPRDPMIFIKAGSFSKETNAKAFSGFLKGKSVSSRVHPDGNIKSPKFNVVIGPFKTSHEAEALLKKFQKTILKDATIVKG